MPKVPESYVSKCPRCNGTSFVRIRALIKESAQAKEQWATILVGCPTCHGAGVLKTDPTDPVWVPHNTDKEWNDENQ